MGQRSWYLSFVYFVFLNILLENQFYTQIVVIRPSVINRNERYHASLLVLVIFRSLFMFGPFHVCKDLRCIIVSEQGTTLFPSCVLLLKSVMNMLENENEYGVGGEYMQENMCFFENVVNTSQHITILLIRINFFVEMSVLKNLIHQFTITLYMKLIWFFGSGIDFCNKRTTNINNY